MNRAYYSASIKDFRNTSTHEVLGYLNHAHSFDSASTEKGAWLEEVNILKGLLTNHEGRIYFEFSIPRMGRRIDAVLLIGPAIFVLEFKIGETAFTSYAIDQVCDYALDLKNFHESSHDQFVAPVLIATEARQSPPITCVTPQNDKLLSPIRCNTSSLKQVIDGVLTFAEGNAAIDPEWWESGRYCPTPTIIEAALALYKGHSVTDISRNDAGDNLNLTSNAIDEVISFSKENSQKAICFVTGVPGAGKTLVGLNTATKHRDENDSLYSVFLSGNGPLVKILCEALARDHFDTQKAQGKRGRKGESRSKVQAFVQNVHHFRDDCLKDLSRPPIEHVALFDEAQRAWDLHETASFMRRKKATPNFNQSEPEFLISCLDRHDDWAVVVCLVGGGQEINRGEAGISEWVSALNRSFPDWHVYISSRLTDSEYAAGQVLEPLRTRSEVTIKDELHLAVSMRSFRAEHVSLLVKQLLDLEKDEARKTLANISAKYPIVLTRDLARAKRWLKERARGTERYGIIVSSQAERLKPHAIDVKSPMDPIHWFLDGPEDVRSSYYLEDVATEFDVQGLELDWSCVTWDADFRYTPDGWQHKSFCGASWNRINKRERQIYQKNAYRVLLTRARQGMVIVVPSGDSEDPTRNPEFYDPTFEYLKGIGFRTI